jgi:hypothetical protein
MSPIYQSKLQSGLRPHRYHAQKQEKPIIQDSNHINNHYTYILANETEATIYIPLSHTEQQQEGPSPGQFQQITFLQACQTSCLLLH